MKLFKNETGRSMLEMLGVLAVIGVLSVAGVSGYRLAMDRIIANQAADILNFAIMSLQPDDTIYESLRDPDNGYAFPADNVEQATRLFADTYGLKCPTIEKAAGYVIGCPIMGNAYYSVQMEKIGENELFTIYFKMKRPVNYRSFRAVLMHLLQVLRHHSEGWDMFRGIGGYHGCYGEDCTESYIQNSENWGGNSEVIDLWFTFYY